MNKYFLEPQEVNKKLEWYKKKNINTHLNEIMRVIQDWKTEFSKDLETSKKTQVQMKMELKNSVTQLEDSGESFRSRINQAEHKVSGLKDKVRDLIKQATRRRKSQEHAGNIKDQIFEL